MTRKQIPESEVCPRCHGRGRLVGRSGPVSAINEKQLLRLHAKGLSQSKIALLMGISRQLVHYSLKRLGVEKSSES